MRVLHVNKRYPPHIGGIERHVQDLARAEAQRPGIEVEVVVVAEGPAGEEWDEGVRVHRVPGRGTVASNPLSPALHRFLLRSARSGAHDVWHFHYPFPSGELALVCSSMRSERRPAAVCSYHSDMVAMSAAKRALSTPYAALTRVFLRNVDALLVASPQLAGNSRFLAASPDRIHLVPYGIDPTPFSRTPAGEAAAARLRRTYGTPLTLFVGRLVPYKGVDVLLRAMPHVPGSLVLVGDGPLRRDLEGLAEQLDLAGRVRFIGSASQDDLVALFHAADLLALPSVTPNEAFGLVQLEAHACGVPVVSTALPTGVPFANLHGVTGLVVAPGDSEELAAALGLLLEDESLRAELGRRARARLLDEFTLGRMVDQVLGVYEKLAAPAKAGTAFCR
jgi:glycosyltransferase involved in cell wall biosynthesis